MKRRLCAIGLFVLFSAISVAGCSKSGFFKDGGTGAVDTDFGAIDCADLADGGADRDCYLSIPDSELVLNPFDTVTYSATDTRQDIHIDHGGIAVDVGILTPYKSGGIEIPNAFGVAGINVYGGYLWANGSTSIVTRPDMLVYSAEYDNGLKISAKDYFYDENTIVRIAEGNAPFVYWGTYAAIETRELTPVGSRFLWRRTDGTIEGISFSCSGKWKFYSDMTSFRADSGGSGRPAFSGIWCFKPDFYKKTAVSFSVGSMTDGEETIGKRVSEPFDANNYSVKLDERTATWNKLLNRIPVPSHFSLNGVERYGVSDEEIESYYYRSWVLILSSLLPANDFCPYRTLSLGKASLWSEGSENSRYMCIWESLFGTQMYSFVDPSIAWEICLGVIENIPSNGNIDGESLPSNKAETVWLCYRAEKDTEKLRRCVAGLERYLNWRFENPRWIINGHDISTEKDADFVSSYLVDLKFMRRICAELGLSQRERYWVEKAEELYADSEEWFFGDGEIKQYYYVDTKETSAGSPLWVYKFLWADELSAPTADLLLGSALAEYDPSRPFAGFASVKYDCYAYTTYGMMKYGKNDVARSMAEACIRDIVRSGFIGELYNSVHKGLVCEGVRPSLFGAMLMIDNVWLTNGFMFHEGGIRAVGIFSGQVSGITIGGMTYDLKVGDGYAETVCGDKTRRFEFGSGTISKEDLSVI